MDLDAIVLVKPDAYERLDKKAIENAARADQRVFGVLESLIKIGENQIKAKTGYTSKNLPDESPKRTPEFELDGIKFGLVTDVQVINPPYQTAFDKIIGFLEVLANDWKQGIRRDNVRTYDARVVQDGQQTFGKAPFIEWSYLMWNVLWYLSRVTELGVMNEIEKIKVPAELDEIKVDTLTVPLELIKDFNIEKPGAARLWYLARKMYADVSLTTVVPVKEEMAERSGVTVEKMPEKTTQYLEQVDHYLSKLLSIPSPRKEYGRIIKRMFLIPQKKKPEGSKALPVVPAPENYLQLLGEYKETLQTSLKRWKNLEGNIGELVVFYYGIEDNPRVQEEFPYIPTYQVKREDDKMFVHIQAIYDRMKALGIDYTKNRLLRRHSVMPIV